MSVGNVHAIEIVRVVRYISQNCTRNRDNQNGK